MIILYLFVGTKLAPTWPPPWQLPGQHGGRGAPPTPAAAPVLRVAWSGLTKALVDDIHSTPKSLAQQDHHPVPTITREFKVANWKITIFDSYSKSSSIDYQMDHYP